MLKELKNRISSFLCGGKDPETIYPTIEELQEELQDAVKLRKGGWYPFRSCPPPDYGDIEYIRWGEDMPWSITGILGPRYNPEFNTRGLYWRFTAPIIDVTPTAKPDTVMIQVVKPNQ